MEKRVFQILNSKKGSSLPEALIGFLMAVLTSLILVGVVMTSENIMAVGKDALDTVYEEQKAFDIFLRHDYGSLFYSDPADPTPDTFQAKAEAAGLTVTGAGAVVTAKIGTATGDETVFTLQDLGDPDDPNNGDPDSPRYTLKKPSVTYCKAVKSKVFCFTTQPGAVIP